MLPPALDSVLHLEREVGKPPEWDRQPEIDQPVGDDTKSGHPFCGTEANSHGNSNDAAGRSARNTARYTTRHTTRIHSASDPSRDAESDRASAYCSYFRNARFAATARSDGHPARHFHPITARATKNGSCRPTAYGRTAGRATPSFASSGVTQLIGRPRSRNLPRLRQRQTTVQ